jgi:hypothetical protein
MILENCITSEVNMKNSNKVFWVGLGSIFLMVFLMTMPFRVSNAEPKAETFVSVTTTSTGKKIVGNDKLVTKTKTVEPFEAINVNGNFYVTLRPGTSPQVAVTTDENIMPYLKIGVAQGALNLSSQSGMSIFSSQPQKVEATTTSTIKKISMMGNNRLEAKNIKGESLVLDLSGNGEVHLAGEVKNLTLNILGRSTVYAKNLKADNVTISGSGNVDVTVHAVKKLILTASGQSNIKYYGKPEVTKTAFGFVTVQKMDDAGK